MKKSVVRIIALIMSVIMLVPIFSACESSAWKYTKEDMASFTELVGFASAADKETSTYKIVIADDNLSEKVKAKDVLLFDYSEIDFEKEKSGYLSYDIAKKHKVEASKPTVTKNGIEMTFKGKLGNSYALLVNKRAVKTGNFGIAIVTAGILAPADDGKFENDYISAPALWDAIDLGLKVDEKILSIIVGAMSGSPVSIVSGAFGLASIIGGSLFGSEVTNADIMKRLDVIDDHIAELGKQIDKNQTALINEDIIIEAGIDKVTLELYNQNWDKFVSDYLEPIQNIEREYSLYLQKALKSVAENGITVTLRYDADGKLLTVTDAGYDDPAVSAPVELASFGNAKAFLASHKNTVVNGFVDAMLEDIKSASLVKNSFPVSVSAEQRTIDIYQTILEELEREYFSGDYGSSGYTNSKNVYNAFINLAKHISSEGSGKSIIDSFLGRLEYIYNFASEMKTPARNYLANMRILLDRYALMATRACIFAEISQEEVGSAYTAAAEYIKASNDARKDLDGNYSIITKCVVKGQYCCSEYVINGTATDPTVKLSNFFVGGFGTNGGAFGSDIDTATTTIVNSVELLKINKRFEIMKEMGLASGTLFDYLVEVGVTRSGTVELAQDMQEYDLVGDEIYRFLTEFNERDLKSSDQNDFKVKAVKHNSDSDYFTIGKYYGYRSSHDGDHWSGKILETKFIDGITGKVQDNTRVTVYARYSEGHWYWITDERWCFLDADWGNYYFVLYK